MAKTLLPEALASVLVEHGVIKPEHNCVVTKLEATSVNQVYKVHTKHCPMLVKQTTHNLELPIDREQVFAMQKQLYKVGLAPEPLFLSHDHSIYCEHWINCEQIPADQTIYALAHSLFNIHRSDVEASELDLGQHWSIYWRQLHNPSADLNQQYENMQVLWAQYAHKHRHEFVLCHNDLHIRHVSYLSGPLFDWEYAQRGCRYFDLSSCIKVNQFNQEQKIQLLTEYSKIAGICVENVVKRVDEVACMLDFTYQLWTQVMQTRFASLSTKSFIN